MKLREIGVIGLVMFIFVLLAGSAEGLMPYGPPPVSPYGGGDTTISPSEDGIPTSGEVLSEFEPTVEVQSETTEATVEDVTSEFEAPPTSEGLLDQFELEF